ncbi:AAA family ATPase [Sediminibacter sp. Hel_I_10]|uniref:AAA family ATPase n=1 Tax=Sediminibacter sp. Hel_I_10 TaxID=1392490 RepID=UPI00047D07F4|nr:ATP-binding protein [Sediminibacter sp. Hel_I_10]
MNTQRIVITGGPGTGKSSIINALLQRGKTCYEEVSRQVTLEARKSGVEQLFLTDPLLFSNLLLKARTDQFLDAKTETVNQIFYDRGLPDVLAYMDFVNSAYPENFTSVCEQHVYDHIFILAPWKDIFVSDNERYENFEQAEQIHQQLIKTYKRFGYELLDIPFGTVSERTDFILNHTKL